MASGRTDDEETVRPGNGDGADGTAERTVDDGRRVTLPTEDRPAVATAFRTIELPATPQRDRRFPASMWLDGPTEAATLGADLPGRPDASFLRRIGRWLLWRAGPASGGEARYLAVDSHDLARQYAFRLGPDGTGTGTGPGGTVHTRFRTWKEDLRDS
jgi:hypothetical protein